MSSLTHWLSRSLLFNFHIFLNFPNFLLLLISNFTSFLVREHIFKDFKPFIFIETCFVAQHTVSPGKYAFEKNIQSPVTRYNVLEVSVMSL